MADEKDKDAQVAKPEIGEETKGQGKPLTVGGIAGMFSSLQGYQAPPPGTFATYRRMRGNPTIALARMAATMPIRTAEIGFEAKDDATPDMQAFIQGQIEPLWPSLIKDILYALDYGFASFEKVWAFRENRLVYEKVKPLLPEKTKLQIDKDTGAFAGIKQAAVELAPEKCFLFTYDGEAGDLYGRSRHENVRSPWNNWEELTRKEGMYVAKVAGVTPIIEYPEGVSQDEAGSEKDNFDLAKRVLANLGRGAGVVMPNKLAKYAQDLVRSGVDISKLKAWHIEFLEPKGRHGYDLVNMMRHKESLMLRGWLVPERTVAEGQFGTKAEASAHGVIAVEIAMLVMKEIISAINKDLINPLLVYNWGRAAEGQVYISLSGLSPQQQLFYRELVTQVLTNPNNIDLFLKLLDYDALIDKVGLPKSEEVVDVETSGAPEGDGEREARVDRQAAAFYRALGLAGRG